MIALTLAALALLQQQPLERRVAAAPEGSVRFSFAAKPGVYRNGRNMISWNCDKGNCHNRQVDGNWNDHDDWDMPCDSGPVRIALTKSGGRLTHLPGFLGGGRRATTTPTDLRSGRAKEGAAHLLPP